MCGEERSQESSNLSISLDLLHPDNTPTVTNYIALCPDQTPGIESYRYWLNRKERWHGPGSLKDVSLKGARLCVIQRGNMTAVAPTFKQRAEEYIEANWERRTFVPKENWKAFVANRPTRNRL